MMLVLLVGREYNCGIHVVFANGVLVLPSGTHQQWCNTTRLMGTAAPPLGVYLLAGAKKNIQTRVICTSRPHCLLLNKYSYQVEPY